MNLYVNHSHTYFNVKRNLLSTEAQFPYKNTADLDLEHDKEFNYSQAAESEIEADKDCDKEDILSDLSDSERQIMMLDFLQLRPVGEETVGGVWPANSLRSRRR